MDHLIRCVRRYPCLWNTAAIEYRDQELKDAAWAEVMRETDLSSVKEVKLKWKKLRDSYRDALKRQGEAAGAGAGAGAAHPGKRGAWRYSAHMHFLQPYMNNRRKAGEAPAPPAAPAENGLPAPAPPSEPEPEPEPDSEEGSSPSERAPGGRKRARPDPLETFFAGMCQATRRLPFPAQLRIKRALFEAVAAGEEALLADRRRYAPAPAPAPAPAHPDSSDDD